MRRFHEVVSISLLLVLLALAVFANRTVTHMWSFLLSRWARLSNAVVAASG